MASRKWLIVACENENKGCLFDLFLHTSLIVSMLGWFLYFKITVRIGSETFSNKESLGDLYSGILRFFTLFEKKEFSKSVILPSSKIFHHFQLTRFLLWNYLVRKKRFHCFPKSFCYHWHHFYLNWYNKLSLSFLAVKRNNFVVMYIVFCFRQLFLLKTYCEV